MNTTTQYDIPREILDEVVTDIMLKKASDLNNQGMEAQLIFLTGELGSAGEVLKLLEEQVQKE